jgi:cobalt-precorrin-7 (C5)-methyltransferase
MKIVGIGAGPNLLTEEAISAIEHAEIIFGSKRAIELAREYIKCVTHEITDYKLDSLPEDAVVLSTGDPMLSGLGKFAEKDGEVIPGISSLQLACSRLHLDMDNLAVITAHSGERNVAERRMAQELMEGKKLFILPGGDFGVKEIADEMKSLGLSRKIYVCERLAYPDEKIRAGTTEEPPSVQSTLYCIVISDK